MTIVVGYEVKPEFLQDRRSRPSRLARSPPGQGRVTGGSQRTTIVPVALTHETWRACLFRRARMDEVDSDSEGRSIGQLVARSAGLTGHSSWNGGGHDCRRRADRSSVGSATELSRLRTEFVATSIRFPEDAAGPYQDVRETLTASSPTKRSGEF
jgi:hypothetical protein